MASTVKADSFCFSEMRESTISTPCKSIALSSILIIKDLPPAIPLMLAVL